MRLIGVSVSGFFEPEGEKGSLFDDSSSLLSRVMEAAYSGRVEAAWPAFGNRHW